MADEKTEPKIKKEEKKEIKTVVVAQLPTQSVTKARDEEGNEFNLITMEEAITEILERVRELKKGLL